MKRIFVNLTNGLEYLRMYPFNNSVSFIRIQSTWVEMKLWNDILYTISDDLLMHLAIGTECIVVDASNRHKQSKALRQGLAWIIFVLKKVWKVDSKFQIEKQMLNYFEMQYREIPQKVMNKIKYYRKFLLTNKLDVEAFTFKTKKDGKYLYFREMLYRVVQSYRNYDEAVYVELTNSEQ